jgi:hypothetical protein
MMEQSRWRDPVVESQQACMSKSKEVRGRKRTAETTVISAAETCQRDALTRLAEWGELSFWSAGGGVFVVKLDGRASLVLDEHRGLQASVWVLHLGQRAIGCQLFRRDSGHEGRSPSVSRSDSESEAD